MSRPKFQHDCEGCIFLGHFNNHDLYCCNKAVFPTVLARYGDKPYEYTSGIPSVDSVPELTEATKRAVKQGFVSKYHKLVKSVVGDFID